MTTSDLQVWDCRKCASIRSAPCGGVCLPADNVTRESTRPLSTHQSTHHAGVAYAVSQGHDRNEVEAMTTRELVDAFGVGL
ncbi:hypothetical protein [Rhodococcus sp. LW-XY12]|uniref:hypothetical protein n=1 Tax=Rhodococcus sp. LW-XY12 TaxID=2856851 RepID=UPI001C586BC8|nr:hypothetical protein [Rhodococcus sp. LW-XY12]QXU53641.1 hypothetical protein KXC42_23440 [Rhodococcus sp. LW-XY12]